GREARRRASALLDQLGLASKHHLRPAELSGGEKQRVAIAQALAKSPSLCFADEPTSALDWTHGEQIIALLRAPAADRGATVLVVSHAPRVVAYADHVFHIDDGVLDGAESTSDTPQGVLS